MENNKNRGGQGIDPQPQKGNDHKGHNGNGNNGGHGRPKTPGTSHPSVASWKKK